MAKIRLTFPDQILNTLEMTVDPAHVNPSNHLAFDRLANYLMLALDRFLEPFGIVHRPEEPRNFIVADLAVDYQGEAFAGERLTVDIAIGEKYSKGLEVFFRIRTVSDGKPVALAKMGIIFFDYSIRKPVPVPESLSKAA